ncbi:P-loop containing nucleoside triphosphate hydrolase protein [Massariosphaeria phaeospora]|uniref:P-loop containing nucleoside triphosphate hydrolase protein n=1 Tax=Massariosphaeria phaeospora TaxID=100035 RepID=A0A7C8M6K2_9PLEO|nr:P-loop containing nucleoside triphosphate hydrolase protein [Massariosphaeria phaeospora]
MAGPSRGSKRQVAKTTSAVIDDDQELSSGSTEVDDTLLDLVMDDQWAHNVFQVGTGTQRTQRTQRTERTLPLQSSQTVEPQPAKESLLYDGLVNTSTGREVGTLSEGVKDLISTMNELEKLNLSNLDIQLARIVVIGDQSAGKSSVIEKISDITVPRAGGTCTRCPMFIKLDSGTEHSTAWTAKVYLRNTTSQAENGLATGEVFFAQTDNPPELEKLISRAQLALLNPMRNYEQYIPGSPSETFAETRQLEFSKNVVCIYVSAPWLPDLSFYDLPGVILGRGNPSKEDLKTFVKDLVIRYIEDENSLILLTSSLEVDWDISSNAAELVTLTKATGRCVGVLTKPDRIDNAARYDEIEQALKGELDALGHGYFIVKSPSQSELTRKITRQEARDEEERFFTTAPWATTLSQHRERFGSRNLQTALSRKLAALSLQAIPGIAAEIAKKVEEIDAELMTIPKPTRDVVNLVIESVRTFTDAVRQEIAREYSHSNNKWKMAWDQLRKDFAERLDECHPRLLTEGALDQDSLQPTGPEMIDLCYSDEEEKGGPASTLPSTPHKRKLETPSATSTPSGRSFGTPSKKAKTNSDLAQRYSLDQTRERLLQMSSAKLLHQVNPKAIECMMHESLAYLNVHLSTFFKILNSSLSRRIEGILKESMAKWHTTSLYKETRRIVQDFVTLHMNAQRTTMGPDTLNDELSGPYFFNQQYFQFHLEHFYKDYKTARYKKRASIYFKLLEARNGKALLQKERNKELDREPLKSLLATDPYEKEVQVIAQVRAYYELAVLRFHESICMRVESQLFKQLSDNLAEQLRDELRINDHNVHSRCVELLAEDAGREAKRQQLERDKANLLAGQMIVEDLKAKYKDSTSFQAVDSNGQADHMDVDHDDLYN